MCVFVCVYCGMSHGVLGDCGVVNRLKQHFILVSMRIRGKKEWHWRATRQRESEIDRGRDRERIAKRNLLLFHDFMKEVGRRWFVTLSNNSVHPATTFYLRARNLIDIVWSTIFGADGEVKENKKKKKGKQVTDLSMNFFSLFSYIQYGNDCFDFHRRHRRHRLLLRHHFFFCWCVYVIFIIISYHYCNFVTNWLSLSISFTCLR